MMLLRICCLSLMVSDFAIPVWAQGSLGGLTGVITDPTGAIVAGATVKVTNLETEAEVAVRSSSEGTYLASGLTPGLYRVTASQPGFKTISREPIVISTATIT